ncbi:MAG: sigma-70 family RNA polymerase sigma factor [Byssovorax sp.]
MAKVIVRSGNDTLPPPLPASSPRDALTSLTSLVSLTPAERHARAMMPDVRRLAIRLGRKLGGAVSVADLVGAGLIALTEASARVDVGAPNAELQDYLWYRVQRAMLDLIERAREPEGEPFRMSRRLLDAIGRAACASGGVPDEGAIAAAMGVSPDDYHALLRALGEAQATGLDLQLPLTCAASEPAAERAPAETLVGSLARALGALPLLLQQIFALRRLEGSTLGEIGAALSLTPERVRELEVEAIFRLRAALGCG